MKKLLYGFTVVCLCAGMCIPALAAASAPIDRFQDVEEDHIYSADIAYVAEKGYMIGYHTSTFAADDPMTRAMTATAFWNMEGKPVVDYYMPFSDVQEESWYGEAVRWAASQDILANAEESFRPEDPVTREEAVTGLYRLAGNPAPPDLIILFRDAEQISEDAEDPVRWAISMGILSADENTEFDPKDTMTRGAFAAFLKRYCEATE